MKYFTNFLLLSLILASCNNNKLEQKGFQVNEIVENEQGEKIVGLPIDSLNIATRPRNVLLTKNKNHRLLPIYKVNFDKKSNPEFIGTNAFHTNWEEDANDGNNWNGNFMPGFSALSGYNLINISHTNNLERTQNNLFDHHVLIKTLYYPAFSKDTLNNNPVARDYYMVSVYDEDTNKDGFINFKDLRRFYHFNIDGKEKTELTPKNYSVLSSEYDSDNDYMYIFARLDQNNNGEMDTNEPTHIFRIDLKNPQNRGLHYKDK